MRPCSFIVGAGPRGTFYLHKCQDSAPTIFIRVCTLTGMHLFYFISMMKIKPKYDRAVQDTVCENLYFMVLLTGWFYSFFTSKNSRFAINTYIGKYSLIFVGQ